MSLKIFTLLYRYDRPDTRTSYCDVLGVSEDVEKIKTEATAHNYGQDLEWKPVSRFIAFRADNNIKDAVYEIHVADVLA